MTTDERMSDNQRNMNAKSSASHLDPDKQRIQIERSIEALISDRHHGASSINGFLYQILYSVYYALTKLEDNSFTLLLENLEDVDLALGRNKDSIISSIQVKYRREMVKWNDIYDIVSSFYSSYCADSMIEFVIVSNKPLAPKVYELLDRKSNKHLNSVLKGIRDRGKHKDAALIDIAKLIDRIHTQIVPEHEVVNNSIKFIMERFSCPEVTSKLIFGGLTKQFFVIASQRGSITHDELMLSINDMMTAVASNAYNAFGEGLITKIDWKLGRNPEDFQLLLKALPGDVYSNFDVQRKKWLVSIEEAFLQSKAVIIRAPSGSGKSTLMYRYAINNFLDDCVFVVHKVDDASKVERIKDFIKSQMVLYKTLLVLIDDVNNEMTNWSKLIESCRAYNVYFLVTCREDRWFRYSDGQSSLYRVVPISLEIDEAKLIYDHYQQSVTRERCIDSFYVIWEKLGKNKLLIEFLSLCRNETYISEMISDQLVELRNTKEWQLKLNLLKIVCLYDVLGIECYISDLKRIFPSSMVLSDSLYSMNNEFLVVDNEQVCGIQTYRSICILNTLHTQVDTVIDTLNLIVPHVDSSKLAYMTFGLLKNYSEYAKDYLELVFKCPDNLSVSIYTKVIEAAFNADLFLYVESISDEIDQSFDVLGYTGVFMLAQGLLTKQLPSAYQSLLEPFKDRGSFPQLMKIIESVPVNNELLKLTKLTLKQISFEYNENCITELGVLLTWYDYVRVNVPNWLDIRNSFGDVIDLSAISEDKLSVYLYGLYRYDKEIYQDWMNKNPDLLSYLKLKLECPKIEVSGNEITITFIPILTTSTDFTSTAYERLRTLYFCMPFYEYYSSTPVEYLSESFKYPKTNNTKRIANSTFEVEYNAGKNKWFLSLTLQKKVPKTRYEIMSSWSELNHKVYVFFSNYRSIMSNSLTSTKPSGFTLAEMDFSTLLENIWHGIIHAQCCTMIDNEFGNLNSDVFELLVNKTMNDYSNALYTFFNHFPDMIDNRPNYQFCLDSLVELKKLMPQIIETTSNSLTDRKEHDNGTQVERVLCELHDLLYVKYVVKPNTKVNDVHKAINDYRQKVTREVQQTIQEAIGHLDFRIETICSLFLPNNNREAIILFECNDVGNYHNEIIQITMQLKLIPCTAIDCFILIPIFHGDRFFEYCYMIFTHNLENEISDTQTGLWRNLTIPYLVPEQTLAVLGKHQIVKPLKEYTELELSNAREVFSEFVHYSRSLIDSFDYSSSFESELRKQMNTKLTEWAIHMDDVFPGWKETLLHKSD